MSLIAPTLIDLIRQTMREHPEINTRDENQRGQILDYACAKAGPAWGRKSRNPQGTDLNSDAFCFLRPDGLFEIYDVISGGDGSATWEGYGPFRQGENGYWVAAKPVSVPPPVVTPPPAPSGPDPAIVELQAAVAALRLRVKALEEKPAPSLPDLSGYAKKGDPVSVDVHVSGSAKFWGVNNWGGTGTGRIDR